MTENAGADLQSITALLQAITRSAADPYELAEVTFLEVARFTEPDVFEIGLFEGDAYRTLIRVVEGTRVENQQVEETQHREDLFTWVRKTGEALLFSDFEQEKDSLPADSTLTTEELQASGLFIPLRFGDRVLGVMSLQSNRHGAFSAQDRDLLKVVSSSIAPALATTGLAGEIEFLTLQMLLIQQVSRMLMTLEPLSDRMERIVTLLSQFLEVGEIALYEQVEGEIQLRAQTPASDPDEIEPRSIPEIVVKAIESGAMQFFRSTPDQEEDEDLKGSQFAFPLNIVEHRMGALLLCCPDARKFNDDQIRVLETVSQQLAFAILESRNYAQHQQEAWATTVLLEVARHAARPGDPLAALQAVLQLATLLVGTEWIVLLTYDAPGGQLRFATASGLKRQQTFALAELEIGTQEIGIEYPLKQNEKPIIIDIPAPMDDILKDDQALCLVLSDGQDLLGLLITENELLSGKQPSLMAGIAHQISLRLENSRLI
ncbi:MAG: GAF domain-containing protein, partial [Anaerolineales bacterium]